MEESKPRGQRTVEATNLERLPPTVHDHTNRRDGVTLHTIDSDPDRDVEIYDDGREPHFSGDVPEVEQ